MIHLSAGDMYLFLLEEASTYTIVLTMLVIYWLLGSATVPTSH